MRPTLLVALLAAVLVAVAPPRASAAERPVLVLAGLGSLRGGVDCGRFSLLVRALRDESGEAPVLTVGYNGRRDRGCDHTLRGRDLSTSIDRLGRDLAQLIARRWPGQEVDVVGYSLGGLVVRAALAGSVGAAPGYPHQLGIRTVVTLGTPHAGAPEASRCLRQKLCRELAPGSAFLRRLGPLAPQSPGGTAWTLVGSFADDAVSASSATALGGAGTVRYLREADIPHRGYAWREGHAEALVAPPGGPEHLRPQYLAPVPLVARLLAGGP